MSDVHFEDQDHMAYVDGHIEQTIDFDYQAIDAPIAAALSNANGQQDPYPALADAMEAILEWVWRGNSYGFTTATLRFLSLSAVLNPGLFDDQTYQQIAERYGCTRAIISRHALDFQERFGVHFRRSKTMHSRENYRLAHLGLKRGSAAGNGATKAAPLPPKESSKTL